MLWSIPYVLLGWLLFSPKHTRISRVLRFGFALWALVYLTLGGIFAPLVISAILIAWLLNPSCPLRVALLAAAAGFYAGISRWTWFAAPAVWAGLWILLDIDTEADRKRRLIRSVGVGLAGLAGGILAQVVMSAAFPRPDAIFSTAFSQPLLWYRLLPNTLNQMGILRSLIIAVGAARRAAGMGRTARACALGMARMDRLGIEFGRVSWAWSCRQREDGRGKQPSQPGHVHDDSALCAGLGGLPLVERGREKLGLPSRRSSDIARTCGVDPQLQHHAFGSSTPAFPTKIPSRNLSRLFNQRLLLLKRFFSSISDSCSRLARSTAVR